MANTVEIQIFARDFTRGVIDGIKSSLKDIGVSAGEIAALGGIAGIGVEYVKFIASTIQPAADAETANSRLATAIHAAGLESQTSAPSLEAVAKHLSEMSAFSSTEIVTAFQVMTQFSTVPTESFEAVAKMAMDMAAYGEGGGSVATNVEAIGRVLETGIIPRTWAFTQAQKDQFKALQDSGKAADALQYLLGILNGKYGGQAATELETYNGKVKDMKDNWNTFKENIGSQYLPALEDLLTWVNKNFDAIVDWGRVILAILTPFQTLGEYIRGLVREGYGGAPPPSGTAGQQAIDAWNEMFGGGASSGSGGGTFKRAAGGFASGGSWVGEMGPEFVSLPRGSYVHTAGESARMGGGAKVINFNFPNYIGSHNDLETAMRQVVRRMQVDGAV